METNELIETLGYCSTSMGTCKGCPAYGQDSGCLDRVHAEAATLLESQQKRIAELEAAVVAREKDMDMLRRKWQSAETMLCSMCGYWDCKQDGNILYGNKNCGELIGYPDCQKFSPWIPVEERVPEPEKRVLILTKVKGWNSKEYREIMCGFYEDGNVWCEDSKACWDYEMKREENYDESRDDYRVPEGWFEELLNHIDDYNCVAIGDVVTHWMPLPEMPKEDA